MPFEQLPVEPPHQGSPYRPQVGEPGRYGQFPDLGAKANWITGLVAVKAAVNWWNFTGDAKQTASKFAETFVHWNLWAIAWFLWLVSYVMFTPSWVPTWEVLFGAVLLGIAWNRNVDRSLFRRGLWYKLWSPVAKRADAIPTFLLYLVPFFLAVHLIQSV